MDEAQTSGDIDKCQDIADQMLEVDPTYLPAYMYKASLLSDQEKKGEALQYYKRALEIDPFNYKIHSSLGFLYLEEMKDTESADKHFDKALDALEDVTEENPEFFDAKMEVIRILEARGGNAEKLVEYYGQIMDKYTFKVKVYEPKFLFGKIKYSMELLPQNKIKDMHRLGEEIKRFEILMREEGGWDEPSMVKLINIFKDEFNKYSDHQLEISYTEQPVEVKGDEDEDKTPPKTDAELLASFESRLAADPHDIEALKDKASYYIHREVDYAKALDALDEFISVSNNDISSYGFKIHLLVETEDVECLRIANSCCDRLLKDKDLDDESLNSLWEDKLYIASRLQILGGLSLDENLVLIDRYSRLPYACQSLAYQRRATAYLDAGEENWNKVIEYLDRGISRGIANLDLNCFKSEMYRKKQIYQQALDCLNAVLLSKDANDPNYRIVIYEEIADVYAEMGDNQKVEEYKRKAENEYIIDQYSFSLNYRYKLQVSFDRDDLELFCC